MDWNALINGLIGSGPVALVLAYAWYRESGRVEKWQDRYLEDSKEMLKAMIAVEKALVSLKQEVTK